MSSVRPKILISNDDGIHAPGLVALLRALSSADLYDLYVAAPATEQSATSHHLTTRALLSAEEVSLPSGIKVVQAYAVDGYPADCVKLAMVSLFGDADKNELFRPDLVLSGINRGQNCGYNVIYSGTCAAAREAVTAGTPAIALSLNQAPTYPSKGDKWPYACAAELTVRLVREVLASPDKKFLFSGGYLNVNFPNVADAKNVHGFCLTRQSRSQYIESYVEVTESAGTRRKFKVRGRCVTPANELNLSYDLFACNKGYVSITPLRLRSHVVSDSVSRCVEELPSVAKTIFSLAGFARAGGDEKETSNNYAVFREASRLGKAIPQRSWGGAPPETDTEVDQLAAPPAAKTKRTGGPAPGRRLSLNLKDWDSALPARLDIDSPVYAPPDHLLTPSSASQAKAALAPFSSKTSMSPPGHSQGQTPIPAQKAASGFM